MAIGFFLDPNYGFLKMDRKNQAASILNIVIQLDFNKNHKYQLRPFVCQKFEKGNFHLLKLLKIPNLQRYHLSNAQQTDLSPRYCYDWW